MAVYAIGDLQGAYDKLQALLAKINFDKNKDQLLLSGDLINRGPNSLECLQFAMDNEPSVRVVLGNHDLHFLAVAEKLQISRKEDTFAQLLSTPLLPDYLAWLRRQPLLLKESTFGFYMVHAGLFPSWTFEKAEQLAAEANDILRGNQYRDFLSTMYGNTPAVWCETLQGVDRFRCIVNIFTRMRYLNPAGVLDFSEKGPPSNRLDDLVPWYQHPERQAADCKVIFGHWSTVRLGNEDNFKRYNVYPVDTGCVWGGKLTALRLDDEQWFSVSANSI